MNLYAVTGKSWTDLLQIENESDVKILGISMTADQAASLIKTLFLVAISGLALSLIVIFVWGAITWSSAGDNEEKLQKAKKISTGAVLAIVIFAGFIMILALMAGVMGIDISDTVNDVFQDLFKPRVNTG